MFLLYSEKIISREYLSVGYELFVVSLFYIMVQSLSLKKLDLGIFASVSFFIKFLLVKFIGYFLFFLFVYIQTEAVYGLTEILRQEIQNARLVANPGCYPTSIQLPLVPLIKVSVYYICLKDFLYL